MPKNFMKFYHRDMQLNEPMQLKKYRVIVINTSAGKDSEVMLDLVYEQAKAEGVLDRVVVVHCDLGRVEWAGTRELAERQAARYGLPFYVVSRPEGDLLEHVSKKGKWPGFATRYCTSDHKTAQVTKLITKLVTEDCQKTWGRKRPRKCYGPVKVLNCLGLRADESEERRKKGDFVPGFDVETGEYRKGSSPVRVIDNWHPIHAWTEEQVWAYIREKGLEYHPAYDLGMPRLSCVFCLYAPRPALLLAGYHNRGLLDQYVAVEQAVGHQLKREFPLVQIQATLEGGYVPAGAIAADAWEERCAA